MKITKEYLRTIIKEELDKLEEVEVVTLSPDDQKIYDSLKGEFLSTNNDKTKIQALKDKYQNVKNISNVLRKVKSDFPQISNL